MGIFLGLLAGSTLWGLYAFSSAKGEQWSMYESGGWASDIGEDIGEVVTDAVTGVTKGMTPLLAGGVALWVGYMIMENYKPKMKYKPRKKYKPKKKYKK